MNSILVVGIVSSPEEQNEFTVIAEIWLIGEHFRYLARQQNTHKSNIKKINRGALLTIFL
jgi:hypothetical protein